MIKSAIIFGFLITRLAIADSPLVTTWLDILKDQPANELVQNEQAFCYVDDGGEIQGYNTKKPLGLASVSKLLTSLWSLKKLGKSHHFHTKLYINGNNIHIAGGQDPVYSRRSIYHLINELNKLGIKLITNLTYDQNFYFVPQAIDNSSHASVFDGANGIHYCKFYEPTPMEFKPRLYKYLNTSLWKTNSITISKSELNSTNTGCLIQNIRSIESDYNIKRESFKTFKKSPVLRVDNINYLNSNPFIKNGVVLPGTKVLTLKSRSLIEILKYMNTVSSNLPADLLFHILGGKKQFKKDMSALLMSVGSEEFINFISGSGIPHKTYKNGVWTRTISKMSCENVLKILELFLKYTNDNKIPLFNGFEKPIKNIHDTIMKPYLAVSGVEGTIKNRFQENFQRSLVAKTGTLSDATTLAGTMNTKLGKKHFVFLNNFPVDQNSNQHIQIARNIQNQTVVKFFDFEGEKDRFPYEDNGNLTREKFFTFDPASEIEEF